LEALSLSRQGALGDERVAGAVFAARPEVVALHREWQKLAQIVADPAERATLDRALREGSAAAQLEWSVYILSGEIDGSVGRLLSEASSSVPRGKDASWWAYRFARHYAVLARPKPERLLHAENRVRAELAGVA